MVLFYFGGLFLNKKKKKENCPSLEHNLKFSASARAGGSVLPQWGEGTAEGTLARGTILPSPAPKLGISPLCQSGDPRLGSEHLDWCWTPDRCSWPLLPAASPSSCGIPEQEFQSPSCVACQETSYSCWLQHHLELAGAGGTGFGVAQPEPLAVAVCSQPS